MLVERKLINSKYIFWLTGQILVTFPKWALTSFFTYFPFPCPFLLQFSPLQTECLRITFCVSTEPPTDPFINPWPNSVCEVRNIVPNMWKRGRRKNVVPNAVIFPFLLGSLMERALVRFKAKPSQAIHWIKYLPEWEILIVGWLMWLLTWHQMVV